jgi:hypothetical protein
MIKQEPGGFQSFIEKLLGGLSSGVGRGVGAAGYDKVFGTGTSGQKVT